MDKSAKIYIAGHRGLVGSALHRNLIQSGYTNIITRPHLDLDLTRQAQVDWFFAEEKPTHVFLCAGKVGGIHANATYPAEFLYDNLMIITNVIEAAYRHGVKKLLFLGSSCIYPKLCPQPIREEYLLSSALEETNEAYAIAKITGIEMCKFYRKQYGCNFISAMPTNLYGMGDNFHPQNSHVLPAFLRRFHEAKRDGATQVTLWGTGRPMREFLYVDDLAEALVFLMNEYEGEMHINVGTGEDVTIAQLAEAVARVVGYTGEIVYDDTKPDGTPRKLLDVTRIHDLGWRHTVPLDEGIARTYAWYKENYVE